MPYVTCTKAIDDMPQYPSGALIAFVPGQPQYIHESVRHYYAGNPDFTVTDTNPELDAALQITSTGLTVAGQTPTPAQAAAVRAGIRVGAMLRGGRSVAIGDSVTAGGTNQSWYYRMCAVSGGRIRNAKNASTGGNKLSDMVARVATDLPSTLRPAPFFITGGTNDYATRTLAQSLSDLKAMISYAYAIGSEPVLVKCPGLDNGYKANAKALRTGYSELSDEMNVVCIDPWIDFTDADGGWITGADAGDGVHPSAATSQAAGDEAWLQLSPYVNYGWDGLSAMPSMPGGLLTTQQFFPDTDANGVPDSWVANTYSATVGTNTTVEVDVGRAFNMHTTGVNSSDVPQPAGARVAQLDLTGLSLAEGDRIALAAKVSLTGTATGTQGHLLVTGTGMTPGYAMINTNGVGDLDGAIVWGETVVPAGGLTAITIAYRIYNTGAVVPSVGDITMQQLQVWNLTTKGIV